jgi:hypothetical protein
VIRVTAYALDSGADLAYVTDKMTEIVRNAVRTTGVYDHVE